MMKEWGNGNARRVKSCVFGIPSAELPGPKGPHVVSEPSLHPGLDLQVSGAHVAPNKEEIAPLGLLPGA